MVEGAELLFNNAESFFRFFITVEYLRTVVLFMFFFYILYLLTKFMKNS